ncbi:MAG: porin, partial [Bacteroidota bacterium]|nr:porin [Bacteroidota bacterium]
MLCTYSASCQEEVGESGDRVWLSGGINFLERDSSLLLTLRFRTQNQISLESPAANPFLPTDIQFTIRRLRLRLNGFIVDSRLSYLIQLGFTRSDVDFDHTQFFNVLRDAIITYRILPYFHIGLGLGKLPGNRERVISSGEQQFVDRSIVNRTFNLDRDVGIYTYYSHSFGADAQHSPRISLRLALTSGLGRNPLPRPNIRLMY